MSIPVDKYYKYEYNRITQHALINIHLNFGGNTNGKFEKEH